MAINGAANGTGGSQIVGLVAAVNPNGIKLEGRDGWVNFSKFAAGLVPPQRGQRVTVQLDKSGFVRAIETAEGMATTVDTGPSRDTLIIRQCAIKAAAEFCASRPELKSSDLLALAERMEAWVTR